MIENMFLIEDNNVEDKKRTADKIPQKKAMKRREQSSSLRCSDKWRSEYKSKKKKHTTQLTYQNIIRNAFLRVARINFIEIVDYSGKKKPTGEHTMLKKEIKALIRNQLWHGLAFKFPHTIAFDILYESQNAIALKCSLSRK